MIAPQNVKQLAGPAVVTAVVTLGFLFRRFYLRWGATDAEVEGGLPGDDFLRVADLQATRAVSIEAPAHAVWPWLAQMGQGRGGLYSYDFLENLAGLDIHSADRIHPEWQDIKSGDRFHLAPAASADLEVGLVDTGSALVLRVPPDSPPGPLDSPGHSYSGSSPTVPPGYWSGSGMPTGGGGRHAWSRQWRW